jgi:hypothetical protein
MKSEFKIMGKLSSNITSLWHSHGSSAFPTDVMIPCTEKSMAVLPWVVRSVRKYLRHPIEGIYIVAPRSEVIEKFCKTEGLTYVNEVDLVGFSKNVVHHYYEGEDRSGHMYQQLLKMYSDHIGKAKYIFIHDSDALIIRPRRFEYGGKIALEYFETLDPQYFDHFDKLFPGYSHIEASFICHEMYLEKSLLADMRTEIERLHPGKSWWDTLIALMDTSQLCSFSEYETIGQYIVHNKIAGYSKSIEHYLNKGLTLGNWIKRPLKRLLFPMKYKTVSFHSYQ